MWLPLVTKMMKKMAPSDKNKPTDNSIGEGQHQEFSKSQGTESSFGSSSPSASDVTISGQGMITNIPLITASVSTSKCSINDEMKTFDPGEDVDIERLNRNLYENSVVQGKCSSFSNSSLLKNNTRNYKAGSKINKLADMLAKRSQNVVEVTQSSTSNIIADYNNAPKVEDTVILNNVSNLLTYRNSLDCTMACFEKTANNKELNLFKKSRRKSVPNQSCYLSRLQLQSTSSKSCSDFSKLFPVEENSKLDYNALSGSLSKVQTEESTKKKDIRKNLKNVELPLILPERKRRSSMRNEFSNSNKNVEKLIVKSSELSEGNKTSESPKEAIMTSAPNPMSIVSSAKLKKETRVKQRKSKRLVETSTQTADIEFISILKPKSETNEDKLGVGENYKPLFSYECFYCTQTFTLGSLCKAHEKTHFLKNNKQIIKCQYCFKKLPSLAELKYHCVQRHPNKYVYCIKCDERFSSKEDLMFHNKDIHLTKSGESNSQNTIKEESPAAQDKPKSLSEEKQNDKKIIKQSGAKTDLKIDVSYDSTKKSSVSPRNSQKSSPKEAKTEEQLLEQEMLFYSHLSGNIQENLTNHLDGKIDKSGHPVRTDQINEPTEAKHHSPLSVVTPITGVPDVQVLRAPSPYQTRSKTPNPLPPTAKKFHKLPNWQQKFWEKYNFPTNYRYEHRFWDKNYLNTEKSAIFLKDLSCLDIKTQLTMRENIKKLDSIKVAEEHSKPADKLKFPDYLHLVPRANQDSNPEDTVFQNTSLDNLKNKKPIEKESIKKFKSPLFEATGTGTKTRRKISSEITSTAKKSLEKINFEGIKMITRRQSSIDVHKEDKEDYERKRKGSLDMTNNQRMILRRQTSLDDFPKIEESKAEKNEKINLTDINFSSVSVPSAGSAEISGEWVRPRSYLCGTCCTKFTNLWELEDHKWVSHPNVWCTHYEFEDEKIDKLFQQNDEENKAIDSESSSTSKLKLTDLYKRYLLPHGSLKTAKLVPSINFPEQCTKCKKNCFNSSEMHKHILDCGGDTTWFLTMYSSPMTIKRKWRPFGSRRRKQIGRRDLKRNIPSTPTLRPYHYQHRIRTKPGDVESIQKMLANLPEKRARRAINFDEIKTRSQATIHSNRLLRKRFKTSFASNLLTLKNLKQKRQLKQGKKEGSSKSTTDTSSESTPVGSPKRRNKVKENLQLVKEENSGEASSESSGDPETKTKKRKISVKKKDFPEKEKSNVKTKIQESKKSKPVTRSNGSVTAAGGNNKSNKKITKGDILSEAILFESESNKGDQNNIKMQKEGFKSNKKSKKAVNNKSGEKIMNEEIANSEVLEIVLESNHKEGNEIPLRSVKNIKEEEDKDVGFDNCDKKSFQKDENQRHSISRLKQQTIQGELPKSIEKKQVKLKNTKKVIKLRDLGSLESGNRRSLRLKSQQRLNEDPQCKDKLKKDDTFLQKDLKIKTPVVNLESIVLANIIKTTCVKSENTDEKGGQKIIDVDECLGRRSLRNSISFDERPSIFKSNKPLGNFKQVSILRRSLRSLSETAESSPQNIFVNLEAPKKPTRIETFKAFGKKPGTVLLNGQISLLKRNRYLNPAFSNDPVKITEVSEIKKITGSNDLEEMPILAKVEPIHGKNLEKNEKEIPVLHPVEKEHENKNKVTSNSENNLASFQEMKKRRKISKDFTLSKNDQKIKEFSTESEEVVNDFFQQSEDQTSNLNEVLVEETSKPKKLKLSSAPTEKLEKTIKTNVKKYFLGICPSEIDKGRELQEENSSDSEPLISLVTSQSQKENDNANNNLTKDEIDINEKVETNESVLVKEVKEKEKISEETSVVTIENSKDSFLPAETVPFFEIADNDTQIKDPPTIKETMKHLGENGKKKLRKKAVKRLRMTVSLKEPTLKIIDEKSFCSPNENKQIQKNETEPIEQKNKIGLFSDTSNVDKDVILPERRSRRISKETKSTNEFIIDDPLILVDELWSDLDSDSDSSKKKSKKGKKKSPKKKTNDEKKVSDVNLEELLRNFGENKGNASKKNDEPSESTSITIKLPKKQISVSRSWADARKTIENRKRQKSYKRLSLKLFSFTKPIENFGNQGLRLSEAKKALRQKREGANATVNHLPDLPFLAAEIKENPIQVIQCGAQKTKLSKKCFKKLEPKIDNDDIHLRISLPLESINNTVFNNNHLTELIIEKPENENNMDHQNASLIRLDKESSSQEEELPMKEVPEETSISSENVEIAELKNRSKRSEVIDKIFYCEICKTYYYSSSQLKNHKLSNRHKQNESEALQAQIPPEIPEKVEQKEITKELPKESVPSVECIANSESNVFNYDEEKLNDDNLEMPVLEGPFIEGTLSRPMPVVESVPQPPPPPPPPSVNSFDFNQESLKDLQKAIGCTDEEMLILTLLGENTIELENDILDLDTCKTVQANKVEEKVAKIDSSEKDSAKANGAFKLDLKQRMTSALACLVNKAVFNLIQKYQKAAKSTVNPEALSLLKKLSSLSRRKNILQLNELLKKQCDGEGSIGPLLEKKEPTISYKYQCTICGSRFEKASTREFHISRSHKGKAKKLTEEIQVQHTAVEEEWNDSWTYDTGDDHLGNTNASQFWCSDCGINFVTPQQVLEHQKVEHQAGVKNLETDKDTGPLQSSKIGSSDEIIEGKKTRKRPKVFSSEELDQQRIIANNELRKLDRKFLHKNKNNKIKWGVDALRFTVEKENKIVMVEENKETTQEETGKPPMNIKNIDIIPKLNLSRTSNIPEFKVIQKNSLKNRFQKIIDNKLKRKTNLEMQNEKDPDDLETEVMLVPVVLKKTSKKKPSKDVPKKEDEGEKPLDVYDFNESESEIEPVFLSHVKKISSSPARLKLSKTKEGPSKNKADSTTKDLAPDDYDSEDSLPLSVVKKSKPGDEGEEKDEKVSDDGIDKSEGILEQVEYLIEQLENETASSNKKCSLEEDETKSDIHQNTPLNTALIMSEEDFKENIIFSKLDMHNGSKVGIINDVLEPENMLMEEEKIDNVSRKEEISDLQLEEEKKGEQEESIFVEPESNPNLFDDEDSMPLVLISKKNDDLKSSHVEKKCDENTTDELIAEINDPPCEPKISRRDIFTSLLSNEVQVAVESSPTRCSASENERNFNEKSEKAFETVNGNVIYCRNDSASDFGSDSSNDGSVYGNFLGEDSEETNKGIIKEVTEKEDVVIVCSKGDKVSNNSEVLKTRLKSTQDKKRVNLLSSQRKKKRYPLLTATIEQNNFRKSESSKLNKEVIVRKIWNRRKIAEEMTDNDEDSLSFIENDSSMENSRNNESQTEIEKEIIVKKIWSRKKVDHDDENAHKTKEKFDDVKINQTEVSDEVVIKCGPKTKTSPKRRKSKSSTSEASKGTIMRRIWSGRCTFQTKAALKTYDSDVMSNCKENDLSEELTKPKKRGRPSGFSATKKSKVDSDFDKDDEDDLDSLLEEIEREQLEKAIRLEFLQLRRSEKANVEIMKKGPNSTVGLFTETIPKVRKDLSERRRRKVRNKMKHSRQSVVKRKNYMKKAIRRIVRPSEERNLSESTNRRNSELSLEHSDEFAIKNNDSLLAESKSKIRKHKKHRHKHHHHKHKHKKSKHHKSLLSKHKSRHKVDSRERDNQNKDSFIILEKLCQELPSQIQSENQLQTKTCKRSSSPALKIDNALSPFSFENKTKENREMECKHFDKKHTNENVYDFIDDFSVD